MSILNNFLKSKDLPAQFSRFLLVGGTSASLELFLFYFLTHIGKIYYLYASIGSLLFAVIYSFFFQKYFTFKNNDKKFHTQVPWFIFVVAISLTLNTALVYIAVEWMNFYYLSAKSFAIFIVLFWNFTSQKFIVFK